MKRLVSLLLSLVFTFSLVTTASAATAEAIEAANALYDQGLFYGTGTDASGNPEFDLDRAPTRHEAVTMLVRLLGKEDEAKSKTWTTPFTDVAEWAKPYVGYAYANGLAAGTSATTFSGNDTVTAAQYITFVLRALGYESGADFQWDKAWELSDKIGLTDGRYNADTVNFTRGDVAIISNKSLTIPHKGQAQEPSAAEDNLSIAKMLQGTWAGENQIESAIYREIYKFTESTYSCAYFIMVNDSPLGMGYEEGSFSVHDDMVTLERKKDYSYAAGTSVTKVSDDVKTFEYPVVLSVDKLTLNGWSYQRNNSMDSLYEELKNAVMEHVPSESTDNDYSSFAASDFRSIERKYPGATPLYAYVITFTDKNGDECVLVDLWWKIISNFNDVILHNLTTGRIINDPVTYYKKMADRQYGASKIHYINLQAEVLEKLINEKSIGTYVSKDVLGL